MKKTMLIIALVGLFMGTFTLSAWAKPGNGPDPGRFEREFPARLSNQLGLTLEQQQKILSIRQNFEKDTLNLRYDLRKNLLELKYLWAADSLDQKAIDARTKESNGLKIQMISKRKAFQNELKGVLTPDQLKKVNDFKQKRLNRIKSQEKQGRWWN